MKKILMWKLCMQKNENIERKITYTKNIVYHEIMNE